MTDFLKGCVTAMVTPFTQKGIDFDRFGELLEAQMAGGVQAAVVLGTTGEASVMTEEERETLVRFAVQTAKGRMKIVVGTGSNDPTRAVAYTRQAEKAGADGVLAVTPYYNKCTQEGLVAYYGKICAATGLPVIAYNVPSRTGVDILPETMERIADFPNLTGLKEANGDIVRAAETMRRIRGKCDLYAGDDALSLPFFCLGANAVVSVLSNLLPKEMCEIANASLMGDFKKSYPMYEKLLPLMRACFIEVNPIPIKAALQLSGFPVGDPRPPLTPIAPCHREQLLLAMRDAGLVGA